MDLKILKLRTQWNEFIINKTKKDHFFEKQFHIQYDEEFLGYLLLKINEIIQIIEKYLPPTQIEQVK